ncbi:hypothetical protein ACQPXB_21235 [Amycolatopsis sp. CA-161197]|uniref:hypothetical protein n=1 Tax=Amycolatopsis sp. CA-161197 TaxID=3239922 RepID=UPI003D8CC24E
MTALAVRHDPELQHHPLQWVRRNGIIVGHPTRSMAPAERATWVRRWAKAIGLRPSRERASQAHPLRFRGTVETLKVELHHDTASAPPSWGVHEVHSRRIPPPFDNLVEQTKVYPAPVHRPEQREHRTRFSLGTQSVPPSHGERRTTDFPPQRGRFCGELKLPPGHEH